MKRTRVLLSMGLLFCIGAILIGCSGGDLASLLGGGSNPVTPKFAISPDFSNNQVGVFSVNATTGALTAVAGTPFATSVGGPWAAAVTPNQKFVYFAGEHNDTVEGFSISSTGTLTSVGTVTNSGNPFWNSSLAVSADGKFLVATNSGTGVDVYSLNQTTGAMTAAAGSPFALTGAARTNSVVVSRSFLYVLDISNGNVVGVTLNSSGTPSAITGSPFASGAPALHTGAVDPSGKFLYVGDASGKVFAFAINQTSGALTAVTGSPFVTGGSGPFGIGLDPLGHYLAVTDSSDNVYVFSVNATTGALTPVTGSPFVTGNTDGLASVTFDPSGKFLYTGGDCAAVHGWTLNTTTGALTELATSPFTAAFSAGPCGANVVITH